MPELGITRTLGAKQRTAIARVWGSELDGRVGELLIMFLLIHIACECVFELGLDPMPVKLPAPLLGKRSLNKYLRAYLQLASKMHIVQNYDHVDFSVEGGLNQVKTK